MKRINASAQRLNVEDPASLETMAKLRPAGVRREARALWLLVFWAGALFLPASPVHGERLRVIIETDAGGDPDDEQSLVRFLLYANEWDVEGIIANRQQARDRENRNLERTGLGIVRRLLDAYGECHGNLVQHDPRYPARDRLWQRTVAGYDDTDDAVKLIIAAVDGEDSRPVWYSDWGTDHGAATNNLERALDRVLRERGQAGYAQFKRKLRLSSHDRFGDHTTRLEPAFPIWVDTFRPELDRKRWYHRFSALTATAGGFDLLRDCLTGHGPLGALYPTNTTHWQKEGDTMTFLYLVPNGLNAPEQPTWGGWAGRYGANPNFSGKPYFWANQFDTWEGTTDRENTLRRWAIHLQNDFKARLDWCVKGFSAANHPPAPKLKGEPRLTATAEENVTLDASASTDPDSDALRFAWCFYPETTGWTGPLPQLAGKETARASFQAPAVDTPQDLHLILALTDTGAPPLTRYQRFVLTSFPLGGKKP